MLQISNRADSPLLTRDSQEEALTGIPKPQLPLVLKQGESVPSPKKLDENKSIVRLNGLSADLVEFISRVLIERVFFQNTYIPPELLLHLSNDLIRTLVPEKKETLNMAKEGTILWKQLRGKDLTPDEKAYDEAPKDIDVMGEILNGIKYSSMALIGQNLYSSVASAVNQGLWEHIPAIVGYSSALLLGSSLINQTIDKMFENSKLSQSQKDLLKPWLMTIGRLALGFIPKAHASEEGVHYHYPSTEGSTQTFSKGQTITLQGDRLAIERDGLLRTPEGSFQGTGYAEFKLHEVMELSEARIQIQVVNKLGEIVPIKFTRVQGRYGPEIIVSCEDKHLEEYWANYFRVKPRISQTPDLQDPTSSLTCTTGLTLGALGSLATLTPLPMALGALSCLMSTHAASTTKQFCGKEANKPNFEGKILGQALSECEKMISEGDRSLGEIYYYKGLILKKLGKYSEAYEAFILAVEQETPYRGAEKEIDALRPYKNNPGDISFRNQFLKEIGMTTPSHYEYMVMGALAYYNEDEISNPDADDDIKILDEHMKELEKRGWKRGDASAKLKFDQHGYYGVPFINDTKKHIIIAHRGTGLTNYGAIATDLQIFQTKEPDQYSTAKSYVEKINEAYPTYTISHAGHSLGGFLAGVLAYKRQEIAVIAENPGIENFISTYLNKELLPDAQITSYFSRPNMINTSGKHVGEKRTITLADKTDAITVLKYFAELGKKWYDPSTNPVVKQVWPFLEMVEKDFKQHRIIDFLPLFDPKTGYAKNYRFITKWPEGIEKRINFATICTDHHLSPDNPKPSDDAVIHKLFNIYSTYPLKPSRIELSVFSKSAQEMLKKYKEKGEYYPNFSLRVLSLYDIEGDKISIKSDSKIFTVDDFKNYVEHQLAEAKKNHLQLDIDPFHKNCEGEKVPIQSLWKEYDLFFGLDRIKKLDADTLQTLQDFVQKELPNKSNFISLLRLVGGADLPKMVDEELEKKGPLFDGETWNYQTLLDELFNKKPDQKLYFLHVMNNPDFFVGNILRIKGDGNLDKIFGEITAYHQSERKIDFELIDQVTHEPVSATILLGLDCQIQGAILRNYVQYPLLNYLGRGGKDEEFKLKVTENPQLPEWIKEGTYKITSNTKEENLRNVKISNVDHKECKYKVEIYYQGQDITKAKISEIAKKEPQSFEMGSLQLKELLKAGYLASEHIPITHKEANEKIIIQPPVRNKQLEKLNKIFDLEKHLINELRKEENLDYLNQSIDHLVNQQLAHITDPSIIKGVKNNIAGFESRLKTLSDHYKDVNQAKSVEQILIKILLETNYQRLIKNIEGLSVSEAMELFTQAYQHIKEIDGKNLIIFIGNTGSGKGTSINNLLKNKLQKITNRWSQEVWELSPNQEGPEIGHSIGASQTLFVQGYPLKNQIDDILCDTPGLGDTRGLTHEICAKLSIDLAIRHGNPKAIVITIPYESFLLDKGNPVINLMEEVSEFIPDAFEGKGKDGIYLLITKHGDYTDQDFKELLTAHCDSQEQSSGQDKIQEPDKRKSMWNTLSSMQKEGKVHLIQIGNLKRVKELVNKYSESIGLDSIKDFNTLMSSDQKKRDFAQKIELAAHTWTHEILSRYTSGVLKDIKDCEERIQESEIKKKKEEENIEAHQKTIKTHNEQIASYKVQKEKLVQQQKEIHKNAGRDFTPEGGTCDGSICTSSFFTELKKQGEAILEDKKRYWTGEKKVCLENIKNYEQSIEEYSNVIEKAKTKIEDLKKSIKEKDDKINELSTGNEEIKLDELHYSPEQIIEYCYTKPGARQEKFLKGEVITADDCENNKYDKQVKAKDYTGSFLHSLKVKKEYLVVPQDPELREQFLKQGIANEGLYVYEAILKVHNAKLDLGRKASLDGKEVIYYFKTDWVAGEPLPWIEIIHKLPKKEIYRASIINLYPEKEGLKKDLKFCKTADLRPAQKHLKDVEAKLKEEKDRLEKYEKEILKLNDQVQFLGISSMIEQLTESIQSTEQAITRAQQANQSSQHLKMQEDYLLKDQEKRRTALEMEKRNLAVVIKERWKIARTLYTLTDLVLKMEKERKDKVGKKGNLEEACTAYRTIYEENEGTIAARCAKDLSFECPI